VKKFDRTRLEVEPLDYRTHDLDLSAVRELQGTPERFGGAMTAAAARILNAGERGAAVILFMGAHVIRSGVQRYIINMMENGYINSIAMNGAGVIHDYEFALAGATTESVSRYIKDGRFGMWKETGAINDIINRAYAEDPDCGFGEAVGRAVFEGDFPHKDISLLCAAYRLGIPATVHVGIGCDIIHQHPNCDGAATGALSYNDFLAFAAVVERLEGGVVMNFGSAVMAPEVFLKALSMARNVARQEGRSIADFMTLVCDLHELPQDLGQDTGKESSKDGAAYYFRPFKTMLVRTVSDGGVGRYVKGRHGQTVPALWSALDEARKACRAGGAS